VAFRGDVSCGPEVRRRYPGFGEWLELCGMQRMLFDGLWSDAVATGLRIASTCGMESVRDEAQNMVAFAEWQLGRPAEALRVLEEPLRGEFTTGLVVNASVVAADQGCLAALPYLDRAMRLSPDLLVRQGALARAISLWLSDAAVPDYPTVLATMVHTILAAPQSDDDFHRTLLVLSANRDVEWFAATSPHAANPAQANAVRYYQTQARVLSDRYPQALDDLARVLVDLWPKHTDWVERERTWLAELLLDAVHTDFGKAAWTAPTIEVLLAGKVLELAQELVLAAQAGAHIAYSAQEDDAVITADAERRFLLHPVDVFHRRKAELDERIRAAVANELAKCLCAALLAVAGFTETQVGMFINNWNQLTERRRWDHANAYQIRAMQLAQIDDVAGYIARCQAYLKRPGRRRESHPPPPTDPCVTVSRYTALVVLIFRRC
jgi:hypothetical protein